MPELDPYYLLGIDLNATPEEIRVAYRRRAAESHPDIQPPEKRAWASEHMKQLNAARDLLLDPKRRAKYDERMRLEMQKARWRARRDAYVPPQSSADQLMERRRRQVYRQWTFAFLSLFFVCALPTLLIVTFASQPNVAVSVAEFVTAGRIIVPFLMAIFLPMIFAGLYVLIVGHFWKN